MASVGRPTDYRPEYVNKVDEYLATATRENTHLPKVVSFARFLGVAKSTVYLWAKEHPEFSDVLDRIMEAQEERLQDDGIYGGHEVNASIIKLLLNSKHGYKETNIQEIGGVLNEDGSRQAFPVYINSGQGFVPAAVALPSSSAGGIAGESTALQGTSLAPESEKDIHGNLGDTKAGTP